MSAPDRGTGMAPRRRDSPLSRRKQSSCSRNRGHTLDFVGPVAVLNYQVSLRALAFHLLDRGRKLPVIGRGALRMLQLQQGQDDLLLPCLVPTPQHRPAIHCSHRLQLVHPCQLHAPGV